MHTVSVKLHTVQMFTRYFFQTDTIFSDLCINYYKTKFRVNLFSSLYFLHCTIFFASITEQRSSLNSQYISVFPLPAPPPSPQSVSSLGQCALLIGGREEDPSLYTFYNEHYTLNTVHCKLYTVHPHIYTLHTINICVSASA